jgi:hypothetical protein
MGSRRTGWRAAATRRASLLVVVLYALLVAVIPAFHHDVACHLTSPTHCTACTAGVAAPRAEQAPAVPVPGLHLAGPVADADEHVPAAAPALQLPARAPPA